MLSEIYFVNLRNHAVQRRAVVRLIVQLPLKFFATFLARSMQARMRMIKRRFQRVVVNRRPLFAVQTHVPPEDLVVSDPNQVFAVLRVTDAV